MEERKNLAKNKWVWVSVGAFILLVIAYSTGANGATTMIEEEKVNYEELLEKIAEQEGKLTEVEELVAEKEEVVAEKEDLIESKEEEYQKVLKVIEGRDSIKSEIKDLESELKLKERELDSIKSNIERKDKELSAISGELKKKQDEPKRLSSGTFIVGHDIPASRYIATPNGGSGNFVVYSATGSLKVNVILGGSIGVPEHVFFAEEGDTIELNNPTRFTPVE
ncbi:hypothetical protein [Bacillus alkalicellulosilyticus]|uniref:hypothetical protein n=1 Tax=Alkalihalobacterium alkalicellulosilyticum TaxID=1912214 RepID=UPI000996A7A3|nr:hypothetical protein [Bacillus alkalicellulosilyticus]